MRELWVESMETVTVQESSGRERGWADLDLLGADARSQRIWRMAVRFGCDARSISNGDQYVRTL